MKPADKLELVEKKNIYLEKKNEIYPYNTPPYFIIFYYK